MPPRGKTAPVAADPRLVAVIGDIHGDAGHAEAVIGQAAALLPGEASPLFLQAGDLALPPCHRFLRRVSAALDEADARMVFLDGNHDDHQWLARVVVQAAGRPGPLLVAPRVWYAPRGTRWRWHGRTWLAAGGGVSVDRVARHSGRDWWAAEEITDRQEAAIAAAGPADVVLAHDAPTAGLPDLPLPAPWWHPSDLDRAVAHSARLQRIVAAAGARHVIHGHYHVRHDTDVSLGYGPVRVTGLSCAGHARSCAVLDVAAMEWQDPGGPRTVLVTGPRDWPHPEKVARYLEDVAARHPCRPLVLVHGQCDPVDRSTGDRVAWEIAACWPDSARDRLLGADWQAAVAAGRRGWAVRGVPADWSRGAAGGPERNARMAAGGADECAAFLGPCTRPSCRRETAHYSHGTANCRRLAEEAGIPVRVIR
jgi:hypothetical protein